MTILLIEIILIAAVWLILRALQSKIRFFRGGYVLRRDSYMQDDKMKILVEDTRFFRGKERETRAIRVDGSGLVYSRIPLDKKNNALLVYSYCAPLLSMLKGLGVGAQRTLILGGGGGAVPRYILQNYEGSTSDIVEINQDSIRMSEKYFLEDYVGGDAPRARLIHADAKEAVQTLTAPYQFIFCDLFIGGQPAGVVYDQAFMTRLSELSGEKGMLVINGGGLTMEGTRVILKHLRAAFQKAWVMLLPGEGLVIIACNQEMPALDNLLLYGSGVIALYPSGLSDELIEKTVDTPPSGQRA